PSDAQRRLIESAGPHSARDRVAATVLAGGTARSAAGRDCARFKCALGTHGGQDAESADRAADDHVPAELRAAHAASAVQKSLHATGGYRQAADEIQAYVARARTT